MPSPGLNQQPSRIWTPLRKTILALVFIALGTACLGITLVHWLEWRNKPSPIPIAAPVDAAIDLEALLEAGFPEDFQFGKREILALYVLYTDGCLLCVNDLADYADLLGRREGKDDGAGRWEAKVVQALLWMGDDRTEAVRLSKILNLGIPTGFIDSAQTPDGLRPGLGQAQAALFILPDEKLVFYRILLTTAGTSLARKQANLAKMFEAGQTLKAGYLASQTPLKGE